MKISQKYLLFQKIKSIHNNEFSRCQALATKVPGMRTPIGSKKILPQRVILMLTSLLHPNRAVKQTTVTISRAELEPAIQSQARQNLELSWHRRGK